MEKRGCIASPRPQKLVLDSKEKGERKLQLWYVYPRRLLCLAHPSLRRAYSVFRSSIRILEKISYTRSRIRLIKLLKRVGNWFHLRLCTDTTDHFVPPGKSDTVLMNRKWQDFSEESYF